MRAYDGVYARFLANTAKNSELFLMNAHNINEIDELHWTLGLIQNLEVGLVVVDRAGSIKLWNGFMENHSGVAAQKVAGGEIFKKFPELPARWLQQKLESVFLLRNPAYV